MGVTKRIMNKVNSLWQWTYCTLVLLAEGYLMYRAVHTCKEYNELPWGRTNDKPVHELYLYITCIVVSIMCMPFVLLCAVFKIGNYANDGVRLGRDDIKSEDGSTGTQQRTTGEVIAMSSMDSNLNDEGEDDNLQQYSFLQTLWRHCGPLAVGFHIVAAFLFLFPNVLMDAQKIKHGFLSRDLIWISEMDTLVEAEDHNVLEGIISLNSSEEHVTPPSGDMNSYSLQLREWKVLSPEFVNYITGLIVFSVRYPSVFWYTHVFFTLLFSFQLIIATLFFVFSYCAMEMLYKFSINSLHADLDLLLPGSVIILLYTFSNIIVFLSPLFIFNFGFQHYDESYRKTMRRFNTNTVTLTPPPTGCQGYIPHTQATAALVLFVTCRAPLVYDGVNVYRSTKNHIMLNSIVWDVVYMFFWIILWFFFTAKQSWNFKLVKPNVNQKVHKKVEIYTIRGADPSRVSHGSQQMYDDNHLTVQNYMELSKEEERSHDSSRSGYHNDDGRNKNIRPSSALRKSGERRSNQSRVTFAPSEDSCRRNKSLEIDPELAAEIAKVPRRQKQRNVFGIPDDTPENTLTRNYRHSIRDKCGQYYRHSGEISSLPLESSPVLPKNRPQNNKLQEGHISPIRNVSPQRMNGSSDRYSSESSVRHASPERISHPQAHVNGAFRQPSPERQTPRSNPLKPNRNHRQKPACRANGGNNQYVVDSHPLAQVNHAFRHSKSYSPERRLSPRVVQEGGRTSFPSIDESKVKEQHSNLSKRTESPIITSNESSRTSLDTKQSSPPRVFSQREEVGLDPNKPAMGRRDSALPSSNETSSNDSEDNVLCSQV